MSKNRILTIEQIKESENQIICKNSEEQVLNLPNNVQISLDFATDLGAELLVAPEGTLMANQELLEPSPLPFLSGGFRWVKGRQRSSLLFFEKGNRKSSLAIDTIHAESRRRYLESLSTYARQFLEKIDKPKVLSIDGAPPSISIESRNNVKNSRSTVGTLTEVYDYMRVIYSRIGKIYCTECDAECVSISTSDIYKYLLKAYENHEVIICIENENKIDQKDLVKAGIFEAILLNKIINLSDTLEDETIYPLIDKVKPSKNNQSRIIESLDLGFSISKTICIYDKKKQLLKRFKNYPAKVLQMY